MRIIVYQGDENRAKIEKELTGDIFLHRSMREQTIW